MRPLYTEVFTLKISKQQKQTLEKLKFRNIKVSDFVRKAISEKINRDYENLKEKPKDEFCPFKKKKLKNYEQIKRNSNRKL